MNETQIETNQDPYAPIHFTWGELTYMFGPDCYVEFIKDDEVVQKVFARNIWPREIYEHVDDQEFGVRFEYVTQTGEWSHAIMASDAFVDKSSAKRAAAAVAKAGVDVETGSDHHFAFALGRWRKACDAEVVKIVRTPGWHKNGRVFVNGDEIFGDDRWRSDEDAMAIRRRSLRRGTLEQWVDTVREEVITLGLRAALGTSLAGPLVGMLNRHPFIMHVFGSSSCGKSTSARVAASVWSAPDESHNGLFKSWNTTINALEALAESADGACIVLDELAKFNGSERSFAGAVHNLASKQGRARLRKDGKEREQRSWNLTGLSTGEISMKAKVGDYLQGGQMVRMLDLPIKQGEVTADAEHAERITQRLLSAYGHAGDAWASYLVEAGPGRLDEWFAHWRNKLRGLEDGTAEGGRIISHIALIGAAFGAGRDAGLIPWSEDEDTECLAWLAERVLGEREGAKTPHERALELWYTMIDTRPASFPFENETHTPTELFGYRKKRHDAHETVEVWTSESMLKASGLPRKAGISPRTWLNWCVDEGYARDMSNKKCSGIQRGWKSFPVNRGGEDEVGADDWNLPI